ncbi:MAG: phage head morphogenesis protein [Oscillospiraceae bacterium]|nr:phage head morphogenesis protein [Oscillospiraceae bacterium]
MDRATNNRLRNLDRRLQATYNQAFQSALAHNHRAIQQLADFAPDPDLPQASQEAQWRAHFYAVDQRTGLSRNISDRLGRCAENVGQMVVSESLNIFADNYNRETNDISSQLGVAGAVVLWHMYGRQKLADLFGAGGSDAQWSAGGSGFDYILFCLSQDRARGKYFFLRALRRLSAGDDVARRLMNELVQGAAQGKSAQQIAAAIRKAIESSRSHSMTIARAECLRAASQGRYLAACQAHYELGIPMKKRWVHAGDFDNPAARDQHIAMHMETVAMDATFSNGLMYAHDPNGPPEETINCRCTVVYVVAVGRQSQAYRDLVERLSA